MWSRFHQKSRVGARGTRRSAALPPLRDELREQPVELRRRARRRCPHARATAGSRYWKVRRSRRTARTGAGGRSGRRPGRRRPPARWRRAAARAGPASTPGASVAGRSSSSRMRASRKRDRRREQDHAHVHRPPRVRSAARPAAARTGTPSGRRAGHVPPPPRSHAARPAAGEEVDVGLPSLGRAAALFGPFEQPLVRHDPGATRSSASRSSSGASRASASSIDPALGQQHVVADRGERPVGEPAIRQVWWWTCSAAPWSISYSPLVPHEQVRVARRAVDVQRERVEPHDGGGERRRSSGSTAAGRTASEPGRKSRPRFRPALAPISSWISGSGSATPAPGRARRTRSRAPAGRRRASSPTTISATSAFGPCPAPRNLTT